MPPSPASTNGSAKRSRRFLLVTNVFPPQIGGPATFISTLARKLTEEFGHRVTVVCSSEVGDNIFDEGRPYVVRRLCHRTVLQYHASMRWTLGTELLQHHTVLVNGMENAVYPIAHALGRKYVLKVPGDNVWQMARNKGETTLDIDAFQSDRGAQSRFAAAIAQRNRIAQYARLVVTPSRYLQRMVLGWGVVPARVTTIPNGVEIDRFMSAPRERAPSEPFRILFVGRLTNWKGVETILLALTHMKNAILNVVGDGPSTPFLHELSRQLTLTDRVSFTGRLDHHEVARRMTESHVLVLTSLYEGMSHTLQEAMASGLPCIASQRGGNDEVITSDRDGVLVEPQNVAALVAALSRLQDDESWRQRMALEARETSKRFSMDLTTSAFVTLLTSLSARR